jgi:D-serine dehydratase
MNKKVLTGLIGILLIATVPLAIAQQDTDAVPIEEESSDVESQNILGAAFIAGYILNPQQVGLKTQAKAIALVYYEPGIIFKDRGVAFGLKTVSFREGKLLYMSEPNQLGLVLVAGLVTGFNVNVLG